MRHVVSAVTAIVVLLLSVSEAHAYLDAGTGSMLMQLLVGGAAGLAVLAKLYWHRLAVFLGFSDAGRAAERYGDGGERR